MHEYGITEINLESLKDYDRIAVLATSNLKCYELFCDSVKESQNISVTVFGNNGVLDNLRSVSENASDIAMEAIEGCYDGRYVPAIKNRLNKNNRCALFFFSQDPFINRNDNIIEIAEKVNEEVPIDLITMEFGGKRVFRYDDIGDTWRHTDSFLKGSYRKLREDRYTFHDASAGRERLCIVLAGYKSELYEPVFNRIKTFADNSIDICIITSGMYVDQISDICERNGWSYLSTEENNVSAVQNLAIELHPNAQEIYKLDEDIFITRNFFSGLRDAFSWAEREADFRPGIAVPLIPVNGYGSVRVLEKLNLRREYADALGNSELPRMSDQEIFNDPRASRFMWGEGGSVPQIDELDRMFSEDKFSYSLCPVKFSIGAIYFKRDFWKRMCGFRVQRYGASIGQDEDQICSSAMLFERPILVVENIVVGHLAFGPQTSSMMDYYRANKELFEIH